MFVITADQRGSRRGEDRAGELRDRLDQRFGGDLLLPADQNAGDEVQAILASAEATLTMVLDLCRTSQWSVGLGVGAVRTPLPDATRKAAGPAFVAARRAVTDAKRSDVRFALREGDNDAEGDRLTAADVEPLIAMLLILRGRRTEAGWTVVDLVAAGKTQLEIAEQLGISPPAVSQRLKAALWKVDEASVPALAKLLEHLDVAIAG